MEFESLDRALRRGLQQPLPGAQGQLRLSPRPRYGWRPGHFPEGCRVGAGLVLLYPKDGQACVVLTVRDSELPAHAGEVSLPGGAVDAGETVEEAALREAREEIDLDPQTVEVLGRLSPLHIPVSKFALHPVVARTGSPPRLRPRQGEVDRILEPRIAELCDPARLGVETRGSGDRVFEVPYIDVDGERVWGATAMILAELLCLLGHPPRPPF